MAGPHNGGGCAEREVCQGVFPILNPDSSTRFIFSILGRVADLAEFALSTGTVVLIIIIVVIIIPCPPEHFLSNF